MAAFDAQAAWADLAEKVAEREGWGRDRLLAEMRKLESKHRLREGLFQRFLRLYGGRFTIVVNQADTSPAGAPGAEPLVTEEGAAPIEVRGGRDGTQRQHAAAAG